MFDYNIYFFPLLKQVLKKYSVICSAPVFPLRSSLEAPEFALTSGEGLKLRGFSLRTSKIEAVGGRRGENRIPWGFKRDVSAPGLWRVPREEANAAVNLMPAGAVGLFDFLTPPWTFSFHANVFEE